MPFRYPHFPNLMGTTYIAGIYVILINAVLMTAGGYTFSCAISGARVKFPDISDRVQALMYLNVAYYLSQCMALVNVFTVYLNL